MGRTRVRGVEIAGVRVAVEVPSGFDWALPGAGLGLPTCRATDAEVQVGVTVGSVNFPTCESITYSSGDRTFEVGQVGGYWWVAVHGWERFERVARFNQDFSEGEVFVTRSIAASRHFPLAHPLDELVMLHRVTCSGGLVLRGLAAVRDAGALLVLGSKPSMNCMPRDRRWRRLTASLGGRDRVVVGFQDGRARVIGTVISDVVGEGPVTYSKPLDTIHVVQSAELAGADRLDRDTAACELLSHTLAPVHDPECAERLLLSAARVVEQVAVLRLNLPAEAEVVPFSWGQRHAALAFTAPLVA
jgi:hypothetical protein